MNKLLCLMLALLTLGWRVAHAESIWVDMPAVAARDAEFFPHRMLRADSARLVESLRAAPLEFSGLAGVQIVLPMPNGQNLVYRVEESPVLSAELAALYPQVKTYRVFGVDEPTASGRIGISDGVFHGLLHTSGGTVWIDSASAGNDNTYLSYYKRDYVAAKGDKALEFSCGTGADPNPDASPVAQFRWLAKTEGARKDYRIAVAATGEYTTAVGDGNATTTLTGTNGIVTAINRVNQIYNRDLNIHLTLVSDTSLIYTDSASDPYTNSSAFTLLSENQTNLDNVIGSAAYDIGHVFSTSGSGVAGLGVACVNGSKAQGVSGISSPVGDAFWIDFVAHEIGHQFGGHHTFNGTTGSCGGGANRNADTAYEPGSGTTIMAYAGICGSENIESSSDATFHAGTIAEITAYTTTGSGTCYSSTAHNNTAPTVSAGGDFTIPGSTPFELTGSASDTGTTDLLYQWDQMDAGSSTSSGTIGTDLGDNTLMRSYAPVCDNSRTFPNLDDLLSNTTDIGETLPTTDRTLNFRLTVRDLDGGVEADDMIITADKDTGPFEVTDPNTAVVWDTTASQTVTWDVASTTSAPVSCANVDILLSINGGATFPTTLLAATPNDGTQSSLSIPQTATANARIKVKCSDNIFFDISNTDFGLSTPSNPGPIGSLPTISAPAAAACTVVIEKASSTGGGGGGGQTGAGWLVVLFGLAGIRLRTRISHHPFTAAVKGREKCWLTSSIRSRAQKTPPEWG